MFSSTVLGLLLLVGTVFLLAEAANASVLRKLPPAPPVDEAYYASDVTTTSCTKKNLTSTAAPTNSSPLAQGQIVTWSHALYSPGGATKRGRWEGYCVGIGSNRGQICTHSYNINDVSVFGVNGTIVGTSTFNAGNTKMTVVVTGGSGGFQGIDQAITVTYKKGNSTHLITKC